MIKNYSGLGFKNQNYATTVSFGMTTPQKNLEANKNQNNNSIGRQDLQDRNYNVLLLNSKTRGVKQVSFGLKDFSNPTLEEKVNMLYSFLPDPKTTDSNEKRPAILIGKNFDEGLSFIKDKNFKRQSGLKLTGFFHFIEADVPNYMLISKIKQQGKVLPEVYNVNGNTTVFNNKKSVHIGVGRTPVNTSLKFRPLTEDFEVGCGDKKLFTLEASKKPDKTEQEFFSQIYHDRNVLNAEPIFVRMDDEDDKSEPSLPKALDDVANSTLGKDGDNPLDVDKIAKDNQWDFPDDMESSDKGAPPPFPWHPNSQMNPNARVNTSNNQHPASKEDGAINIPLLDRNSLPNITFDDVILPAAKKQEIIAATCIPFKHPEIARVMKRKPTRNVLLTSPPGCGKTMMAQAIAKESGFNFIEIKGSELSGKYVGETEKNVKALFEKARQNTPCIIFWDEIDAAGSSRTSGESSGSQAHNNGLTAMLTQMQGINSEANKGIVVIAATNRPDILDPALLRPGRFDKIVAIDLPDEEACHKILSVNNKGRKIDSDFDSKEMAKKLHENKASGADINFVCEEAVEECLTRSGVTEKAIETDEDLTPMLENLSLGKSDFEKAFNKFVERNNAKEKSGLDKQHNPMGFVWGQELATASKN